jgi:hypothetical protein
MNMAVERALWISETPASANMLSVNFVWEYIFEKYLPFGFHSFFYFKYEICKQGNGGTVGSCQYLVLRVIWLSEVRESGRILFLK